MKKWIFLLLGIIISSPLFSQSKSQIISNGISSIKTWEQSFNKGNPEKYIIEEISYDNEGRIIEIKELSRKGEIKLWEKYKFDSNGNLVEELIYDFEGNLEKKAITFYTNNLRTSKEYYDAKGRLYKKKTYEYKLNK
ncbi:MAG: hypothetical protein V1783_02770 [Bacteroidota bacterium]|jgi:hypothetical protein